MTEQKRGEWLSQPLGELDLKIVMVDGIHFRDHCILVCSKSGCLGRAG